MKCKNFAVVFFLMVVRTTPEAPAAIARGAVIELSPEADITGIRTAREMEYAAARVGEA